MPVVVFALGLLRIITSKWLYANRFYWVIGIGVLSHVMTPGVDPITPLFMWIPLYVFSEATPLLLNLTRRSPVRDVADAAGETLAGGARRGGTVPPPVR